MKIQFIGHSAFYIESNGFKGLIDPFITGNPLATLTVDDFPEITHIFVTHGHGDHLGDTVELAKKHQALVITNFEIATFLGAQGVQAHPMHIGGRKTFDFGTVKLTPALHGSGIHTDHGIVDGGNPGGFVITVDGITLYHAGDTGLTMDMKLLADENIDVAMIPIGGNFTMDIRDAVKAVEFVQPKKVIPMHYNTFGLIQADPEVFKREVKNSEVILLHPGESISI
ncbi:MAG: metal-dependent hydrolase [Clostridia bacterium]|nr:metal-dependent hydrolase [Clostridia bacterium]